MSENQSLFYPPNKIIMLVSNSALIASCAEAAHLHAFFLLLAKGQIHMADAQGKATNRCYPIAAIHRMEQDGMRIYEINQENIIIHHTSKGNFTIPRTDFLDAATIITQQYRTAANTQNKIDLSLIEGFLDALDIFNLQPHTEDRTAFHLQFFNTNNGPLLGIKLQSILGLWMPLLEGGRTANIKLEQQGVRFSQPAVQKINALGDSDEIEAVARRILYIESHGGILRYNDIADRVFRANLMMIDTNLGRILACMLRTLHLDGIMRITELCTLLKKDNPLKIKEEIVFKHKFYEHKIRELLLAAAWGMRPAKQYTGQQSAIDAYIILGSQLEPVLFTRQNEQCFSDFLFQHARLEKASPSEAHYGLLERENGSYYLKLNLYITLSKRSSANLPTID